MRELPEGWAWTTLGECFRWRSGGTPSRTITEYYNGGIPWGVIGDLNDGLVKGTQTSISEEGLTKSSAKWAATGSVLLAMYGSIGKLGIAGTALTTNQAIAHTHPRPLPSRYLFWYLRSVRSELIGLGKGGTQKNISQTVIKTISFPLAPLPEQHRIVAKIESLFVRLDEGVAALQRAQANLERHRASVLKAAVEGRLTERWRRENPPGETGEDLLQRILAERRRLWETEQLAKFEAKGRKPPRNWKAKYKEPVEPDTSGLPGLPEGWCWATVDQVVVAMMNGYGKRSNTSGGKPRMVLRLADIRQHQISYRNPRYLDCTSEQTAKYKLADGDVLIVRVNGSADLVGRMVDCRGVLGEVLFCDHFIRAKCMTADTATWLRMCSDTERFRSHVERTKVSTAGQHTVSQGVILPFAFPLPPEREALAIMKLVDHLASHSKPVESALIDGRVSAFRLRQSILKRAFEGRLVPQDPADEPASVLLGRIRAQRRVRS